MKEPNLEKLPILEKNLDIANEKLFEYMKNLENCKKAKNIITSYLNIQKDLSANIHNIVNNISSFKNDFLNFAETKFIKPSLNSFDLENIIGKIAFTFDSNLANDKNPEKVQSQNNNYPQIGQISNYNMTKSESDSNYNNQMKLPIECDLAFQNQQITKPLNLFTLYNFLNQEFNFLAPKNLGIAPEKNIIPSNSNCNEIPPNYLINNLYEPRNDCWGLFPMQHMRRKNEPSIY